MKGMDKKTEAKKKGAAYHGAMKDSKSVKQTGSAKGDKKATYFGTGKGSKG